MTSWLRDLKLKKEQMEQVEPQIVGKRNDLMSLFREDDQADAESRGISGELKDTLLKNDDSFEANGSQCVLVSENKFGVLAQLVHLWACGNHTPSSLSITKKAEEHSHDCYQDVEFSTLVVRHGDCLSDISRLVGIPMEVLQRVNSIANIEHLKPGQNLLIPRKAISSKHKCFWDDKNKGEKRVIANWGDTLWSLADEHNVSADYIRRSNNLPMGSCHLHVGQELIIPSPPRTNCMTLSQGPSLRYLLRKENLASIPALRPIVSNKIVESLLPTWEPEPFDLPCHGGWLSSFYGWKDGRWYFHNGIDIAVERGTEVVASTSGKITWSGWKGGYGKTVCMDHGNGFATLYAHCDNLYVQPGQFVRKGQVIAVSGNTGHSTGPHLHFEIHNDGKTVDPLIHLPPL